MSPKQLAGKFGGIFPAYIWFIVLLALPLVYIVVISFFTTSLTGWGVAWIFTLKNYIRIIDPLYISIFAKSFVTALYSTVITFLLGFPFAYAVTTLPKKWQGRILFLVVLPFWTNAMVRTYGWLILLQGKGLINILLTTLGIIEKPLTMLYTGGAVLAGTIYILLPFMILPVYNSLEKIDVSLIEASRDLGANKAQTFFTVILRQSLPGIMSGCSLVFIPSIGMFYISDILGGANVMLLGNLIRNQFITAHNWPFGAALSVVMTILAVILLCFYKRASGGERVEMFV
ncbi:spermidine/putrescine ABC transporter permease [Spirochaetia bacterium]|nr:spermidine/putrescine ABC transporter permease [Spirochaetia bacterium]